MDWQSAVMLSRQGVAARLTDAGVMLRIEADGIAIAIVGGTIRRAEAREWCNFEDWQPLDVVKATGVPAKMVNRSALEMVGTIRTRMMVHGADDEVELEVPRALLWTYEQLLTFACVYFVNLANGSISEETRRGVAIGYAETWLREFAQFIEDRKNLDPKSEGGSGESGG